MSLDLTIPENRKNIIRKIQQLELFCIDQNSKQAFELLFQAWKKFSEPFWFLCYWNDYLKCGQLTLNAAQVHQNTEVEAQLLSELGWLYMEWEEFAKSQDYLTQSLHLYQLSKDFKKECRLWRYLGVLSDRQKDFNQALNYYQQAINIVEQQYNSEQFDQQWGFQLAEIPNLMGITYLKLGQIHKSDEQLHLSLKQYQLLGEKWCYYQADPLLNLGELYFKKKDYTQAKAYYQDCLNLSQKISRNDIMADVLIKMAELAEAEIDYEKAIQLASEAERIAGIEIRVTRDRAAIYKEKLLSDRSKVARYFNNVQKKL
ncbi:MAG: tetratricopeptide repeat protein [Microcoleaceae cyanobacterium]